MHADKSYTDPEQDSLQNIESSLVVEDDQEDLFDGEFAVKDDDLRDKAGNFIFTIGNVGCGKSTLQNLMVARLWSKEDIYFEYTSKTGDPQHDKLLNDWIVSIKEGHFPERTKQGRLQEFNISISQKDRRSLPLNFLEISGEDIKSIVPTLTSRDRPKINEQLEQYLKTKKKRINKRFIFVSDCEENRKSGLGHQRREFTEDILFNELLRYLLGRNGLAMERISVLMVAAKWDAVESEYPTVARYFRRHFPQTRAVLKSERCNDTYIPFSVGTVEDIKVKDNLERIITSFENKYVDVLIQWIYYTFIHNHLKNMPRINRTMFEHITRIFR